MTEVNALDKEIQVTTTRLINARCRRPFRHQIRESHIQPTHAPMLARRCDKTVDSADYHAAL